MRAGPLADPQVIELLNHYFVPVYTSNDFVPGNADFANKERAERDRVYRAFLDASLSAGSVHVYVLSPAAEPLGSIHVAHAVERDAASGKHATQLLLEKTIHDLKLHRGESLISPRPQSGRPQAPADALILHLTARKLGENGSWNQFPAEDWIVLRSTEWKKLLPPQPARPGDSWNVDAEASAPILTRFFPQTECCTASDSELLSATGHYKHRLEEQSLKGTVLGLEQGKLLVRFDGHSKVLHQFYPNHDYPPTVATAEVIGYLVVDSATGKIESLRLVTDHGKFDKTGMAVVVESVP
jgi:hypothetical protein